MGHPFAEFERRFAAVLIDYIGVFILAAVAEMSVLPRVGLEVSSTAPVFLAIALTYLSASWASPMQATPVQWLLRMRVVNSLGERLSPGYAVLRAVLLIAGIVAAMTLFKVPGNPDFLFVAVPTTVILLMATLAPNCQSGHDFLARSFVVMSKRVATAESRNAFRDYIGTTDPEMLKQRRPKPLRIIGVLIVVGIPVFGLFNIALMQFERNLRYRISYAYAATRDLQIALQEFHLHEGYWTTASEKIGTNTRDDYPDGGYYELQEDGNIRIRFTVIPKLKKISLLVVPKWDDDKLEWECRVEGEIESAILPSHCR